MRDKDQKTHMPLCKLKIVRWSTAEVIQALNPYKFYLIGAKSKISDDFSTKMDLVHFAD